MILRHKKLANRRNSCSRGEAYARPCAGSRLDLSLGRMGFSRLPQNVWTALEPTLPALLFHKAVDQPPGNADPARDGR